MKVLEIIDAFYPNIDGAISVAKNFTLNLNKRTECAIVVPSASKKSKYVDDQEFKVYRAFSVPAPEKYRYALPYLDRKLIRELKKEKFDIIHVHSPFSLGMQGIRLGKKLKVPVVATLHTQYKEDFKRTLKGFKPLVWFMIKNIMRVYNRADYVWTVSNRSCDVLREYGFKGDIDVVRNGTDYVYPDNAEELVKVINDKHNLEGQKNVLLFVGRMAWYKNIKLICDSLKLVKDKGLDYKMLFVGGGFDIEEIKAYANEIGITDKCIFTGEIRDRELIKGYYLRGDLFLLPSTFDMGPITKEEAAAHKTPTLLVKNSCSAERVVDDENGYLSNNNASDYADRIMQICSDQAKMKEMGEKAYQTLYRNWDMVADEVMQKYTDIIKEYNINHKENK